MCLSKCVCLTCKVGMERRGEGGTEVIIYLPLHCHHQNDSCIKMCSDESHFNVSLIVGDKVCPQTTTFDSNQDPSACQPNVL